MSAAAADICVCQVQAMVAETTTMQERPADVLPLGYCVNVKHEQDHVDIDVIKCDPPTVTSASHAHVRTSCPNRSNPHHACPPYCCLRWEGKAGANTHTQDDQGMETTASSGIEEGFSAEAPAVQSFPLPATTGDKSKNADPPAPSQAQTTKPE